MALLLLMLLRRAWLWHDFGILKWVLFYFFILLFTLNSLSTLISNKNLLIPFSLHLITLPYVIYCHTSYLRILFFPYNLYTCIHFHHISLSKTISIWEQNTVGNFGFWFTLFASNSHPVWECTWLVVRLKWLRPLSVLVVLDKVTCCPVTTCQDKQQAGQCSPRTHGPRQYQEYGL